MTARDPWGRPLSSRLYASHGQRPLSLRRSDQTSVRSPSAVASTAVATRQRRQPLDLLILKVPNAVSGNKRPVRLVRIE
jgi:hypothetical protein